MDVVSAQQLFNTLLCILVVKQEDFMVCMLGTLLSREVTYKLLGIYGRYGDSVLCFPINTSILLEREIMFICEIICMIQLVMVAVHMPQTHSRVRTERPSFQHVGKEVTLHSSCSLRCFCLDYRGGSHLSTTRVLLPFQRLIACVTAENTLRCSVTCSTKATGFPFSPVMALRENR